MNETAIDCRVSLSAVSRVCMYVCTCVCMFFLNCVVCVPNDTNKLETKQAAREGMRVYVVIVYINLGRGRATYECVCDWYYSQGDVFQTLIHLNLNTY